MPLILRKKKSKIKKPDSKPSLIFVDTETTGLEIWQEAMPYSVGILWGDLENPQVRYYEWKVDPFTRLCDPDSQDVKEIKKLLEDPSIAKCFHNAKFDILMLEKIGIKTEGRIEDTSFAARVCDTLEFSYKLKDLAWNHFNYPKEDMLKLKDIVKRLRMKAKKKDWNIHPDSAEADYWLCQHIQELMPELSKEEKEEIKASIGVYCVGDVFRTALLWSKYEEDLTDENYKGTYEEELDLLRGAILHMERRGMAISKRKTLEMKKYCSDKAAKHLEILQGMAKKMGKEDFNPNSPKQLAELLYTDGKKGFGLDPIKTSAGGQNSTDWKALRPYQEHPFVRELLMYRSMDKAVNMFFTKYEGMMRRDPITQANPKISREVVKDTYVLHPSLNQCGTITGRFSSNNPNLQQVANPESSPRGTDIQARRPFGPRPGYTWYLCDFAQMELRAFADIANVPGMLETIWRGEDLNNSNTNMAWGGKNNPASLEAAAHALELGHDSPTRDKIQQVWDQFGWSKDKAKYGMRSFEALQLAEAWLKGFDYDIVVAEKSVDKSQSRQRGKTVMFAKMYGGGPQAVTDLLFCELSEAKIFMRQFDKPFPEINEYMRAASSYAERNGYIINRYGRKLRIDPKFSYRAVNYMIQGTCADLMKDGIRKCHKFLSELGIDGHVLMTIHDELIFEIRQGHNYKWVLRELQRIMSDHEGRLRVPMPVEMKKCRFSWEEKEAVEL